MLRSASAHGGYRNVLMPAQPLQVAGPYQINMLNRGGGSFLQQQPRGGSAYFNGQSSNIKPSQSTHTLLQNHLYGGDGGGASDAYDAITTIQQN